MHVTHTGNKNLISLVSAIREHVSKHCNMDKIKEVEIGYIEPGHEVKGKKIWLNRELDVKEMYGAHKKELSIFGALR